MKTSVETNEIAAALAKAQGIINNPGKTAKNPHFKSNYADLSAGINAIREGLSANGIAVIQAPRLEGDVMMLDTRLAHGEQFYEAEWPVCKLPSPPQQIGSALTYARRYALFAMVGIAGEDDDGNAANASATPAPEARDEDEPNDAAEIAEMGALLAKASVDAKPILTWANTKNPGAYPPIEGETSEAAFERVAALPASLFKGALTIMRNKKPKESA